MESNMKKMTETGNNISLITPQMMTEKKEAQINALAQELFLSWMNSAKCCIELGLNSFIDNGYIPWRDEYYSTKDMELSKKYSKIVQYKADSRAKKRFKEELAKFKWKLEVSRREGVKALVFVEKVD